MRLAERKRPCSRSGPCSTRPSPTDGRAAVRIPDLAGGAFRTETCGGVSGAADRRVAQDRRPMRRCQPWPKASSISLRSELSASRAALEKLTIRAPIDGTILQINAKPGESVSPSTATPLVQLRRHLGFARTRRIGRTRHREDQAPGNRSLFAPPRFEDAKSPARSPSLLRSSRPDAIPRSASAT